MPDDLRSRLLDLPPAQRAALARRLLARRDAAAPPPVTPEVTADFRLDTTMSADERVVKDGYRRFYDSVSAQLDGNVFGDFSYFLNYGYAANGAPEQAAVALPDHYVNRNSVKLVLEVIGDCPVDGRHVLDVGCGRGGTAHVFKTFFHPASVTGLDLSPVAVGFCTRAHGDATTRFVEGDSEHMPFAAGAFDIVTNVESSHSYPNIARFYGEVMRLLRPGGHFLYTDALSLQQWETSRGLLANLGFGVERDVDITPNVLLSCDEVATARVGAFDARSDQGLMNNFLATPGSDVYRDLQSGRWNYRLLRLGKPAGGGPAP